MGRCWAASTRFTSCHTGSTSPLTRYSVWMRAPGPERFCAALLYASAQALPACARSSRLYLHQAPDLALLHQASAHQQHQYTTLYS